MFAISSVELVTYFAWHRKAKKAADDGIFVDTPSTIKFQESILVILLIGAVYWLANLFAADDPLYIWVAVVMMAGMFSIPHLQMRDTFKFMRTILVLYPLSPFILIHFITK